MSSDLIIKVQYPPGCFKQTGTLKVSVSTPVRTIIQDAVTKSGNLTKPEDYHLYLSGEFNHHWLDEESTVGDYGITKESTLSLARRYQLVKVRMVMGVSGWTQSLVIDVRENFGSFIPYVLKKFQLEPNQEQYILLFHDGESFNPVPLNQSFVDLDMTPEMELIFVDKNKPPTESALLKKDSQSSTKTTLSMTGFINLDKKKRWIIVDSAVVNVYKSQTETEGKPLLSINLGEFDILLDEKDKKKLTIDLVPKHGKESHQFQFSTPEETSLWLEGLQSASATTASPTSTKKGYFGLPLVETIEEGEELPYIVTHCISYIEEKALEVEGIYRLSGSQNQIDKYKSEFDKGIKVDLSKEVEPHTVAGLLKLFFRDMPEPLLTYDLYDSFIAAQSNKETSQRLRYVRNLVKTQLPPANRAVLQYLMEHLSRVEKHRDVNKMAIHNLATVFAPNLLQQKDGDMLRMVEDTPLVNGLVNTFIQDLESIFGEQEPTEAAPVMAKANHPYTANSDQELSFAAGDVLRVLQQGAKGWWLAELNGKRGLIPGSYVAIMATNKRQQFIQEMNAVKSKIAEEKKLIDELTQTKQKLLDEMEELKVIKETASTEAKDLKSSVFGICKSIPELNNFPTKVEVLYSQLESYHKTKVAMTASKQVLTDELNLLKKNVASEPKFKKFKDKLIPLIDALTTKFDEESVIRKSVDEKKDQLFKDLTELRTLMGTSK